VKIHKAIISGFAGMMEKQKALNDGKETFARAGGWQDLDQEMIQSRQGCFFK
jgi:hypothetical protein